ncbi:MAG: peptide chain release factor 1 [Lachnospiraceae bacterium]|nr:peptide chain release factor 1 [Lachnospiraceae bacterium]
MYDKLNALVLRREDITRELSEPGTAADQKRFAALMKEQNDLVPVTEAFDEYRKQQRNISDSLEMMEGESDPEMKEMLHEELAASKKAVTELEEKLKVLLLPKDPNDAGNVIVEIRAGAGGDEAALFAAEIARMYMHYAESKGWSAEVEDEEEIGIGGIKYMTFTVTGQGAWSRLKYESGVHRVQRVPVTETAGRIHTSTCTVAVMPEAEADCDIVIDPKDIRIDTYRSSGAGGQHINKTSSAIRITHFPTGIVVTCQNERSQFQNKDKAFEVLKAKLYDLEQQKKHDAETDLRRSQIGTGDRSEKIRTYNFPQGRITDHRIKLTVYNIGDVMNGHLDEIIDALTSADQAAKLLRLNEEQG